MSQLSLLDLLTNDRRAVSVGELTAQLRDLLEIEFCDVWVEGEISNFKRHSSGHWYFTLKDEQAQIRCAAFRNQNLYIRFRPQDGLKVRARGRISVYDARGEYQLIVSGLEPVGKGALQLAFEQLKTQLEREGLFDELHKQPLPRLPLSIGIVTSPTGAVVRDIINILGRRNPIVNLLIFPARVQGEGAADEIANGIAYFNSRDDIDVLIVGRGGGSIEDLWPFNEEVVARAIFASRIPIISAVGHETDFTIADYVADCRAPTPSAAAEIVAAHKDELSALINGYREALVAAFQYQIMKQRNEVAELRASNGFDKLPTQLRRARQQLDELKQRLQSAAYLQLRKQREQFSLALLRLSAQDVKSSLLQNRSQFQQLETRLENAIARQLDQANERLRLNAGKLHALSPLAVLSRGYALVRNERGELVKRAAQVAPGEKVRVRLAEGELTCIRELE